MLVILTRIQFFKLVFLPVADLTPFLRLEWISKLKIHKNESCPKFQVNSVATNQIVWHVWLFATEISWMCSFSKPNSFQSQSSRLRHSISTVQEVFSFNIKSFVRFWNEEWYKKFNFHQMKDPSDQWKIWWYLILRVSWKINKIRKKFWIENLGNFHWVLKTSFCVKSQKLPFYCRFSIFGFTNFHVFQPNLMSEKTRIISWSSAFWWLLL